MEIIDKKIENIIEENMMQYANYVLTNRAIPDLKDGMKPVYRRILYTMYKMKATSFTKSQNVEGQVMKFHPHSGSYPTIVGMVQKDNHLTPLINGKGNFAQKTSSLLQPAAPRYSEIKLSELGKELFKDINTTSWIDNYDGTEKMPELLPVKFPLILHQAQEGIAVGMSSRIPSFNLVELNNATINFLETGKVDTLIPDFATGGLIVENTEAFESIKTTGKGSFKLRAKAIINNNIISIKEIPYTTTREAIIESVIKNIKSKNIVEILDIKDLTGLDNMEIEITCKKNIDMNILLEKLYQLTPMEDTYSCNMTILYEGLIYTMGTETIIGLWTDHRSTCIMKKTLSEIEKLEKQFEITEGLEKILKYVDAIIEIIRNSGNNDVVDLLIKEYDLTDDQAQYISDMKIKHFKESYISDLIEKAQDIKLQIQDKKDILNNRKRRNAIIIEELKDINNRFGKDRKTEVIKIDKSDIIKFKKIAEEIKDYPVNIVITNQGYIKKLNNNKGEHKFKTDDYITESFETSNSANIIVFSNDNAYKIKVSDLEICKKSEFGEYIPGIIKDNNIVGYSIDDDKYKFILICYNNGKIAKIDLNSYKTKSHRKKLTKALNPGNKVVKILTFKNEEDFILINTKNKEITKNTKMLKAKSSKTTQGVTVLKNIANINYKI